MLKNLKKICCIVVSALIAIFVNSVNAYAITPISAPSYEGIDVSNWQGYIDYSQVAKSGIKVVYMKASQGTTYKDPYFDINYENAKANGLKVGFYHYLTATTTQRAAQEAQFFASVIAGKVPDCKLVLDYETFGGVGTAQINEIARTFLENIQKITGKQAIVYSNLSNARSTFNSNIANNYQLWLAYYGNYTSLTNVETRWNNWIGVQYTSTGKVPGINGNTDRDLFTQDIFLGETSEMPKVENTYVEMNTQTTTSYTVKKGDTLSKIAREYKTTVQELAQINGISNPNLIYPGQIIKVAKETAVEGQETGAIGCIVYTVKKGDTLSEIAERYGTTVQEIATVNDIKNVNLIYPCEKLRICNPTKEPKKMLEEANKPQEESKETTEKKEENTTENKEQTNEKDTNKTEENKTTNECKCKEECSCKNTCDCK